MIALFHSTGLGFPPPWTSEGQAFDYASKTLLIIGGASNCGRFGIQLAKLAGFERIVTVAAKRNEGELKALGATHVVDRHLDDVIGSIRDIVGDDLVLALDAVNAGPNQFTGVAALSNSKKGRMMILLPPEEEFSAENVGIKSAGYERKLVFGASFAHPDVGVDFWQTLPSWIRKGIVTPVKFEVLEGLDAARVNEALDRYRDGKPTIKLNVYP